VTGTGILGGRYPPGEPGEVAIKVASEVAIKTGADLGANDAGEGSVDAFPSLLLRELRAESIRPLEPGTSPARVWRVATPSGVLAVKVLRRGAGIIDGHDIRSFLKKPAQLRRIHRELPGLSSFYVEVVGVWDHTTWAAYAMPFVEGAAAVSPASPPEQARDRLNHVFGVLTEHGYARTRRDRSDDHVRDHVAKIRRRMWVLARRLPRDLLDGPRLVVNGRSCRPLGPLLQAVETDPSLLRKLLPRLVSYPVHGDLQLGDVLASPGQPESFTVIDPRGTQSYRDPIDDFAKALFSMTVFDRALASGIRIWRTPRRPRRPASYVVRAVDPYTRYAALSTAFVEMLGSLPFGEELNRVDPHWQLRLAFFHAFHTLEEASWRLSPRAPRAIGAAARDPLTLATGFCALGLRLLEQAIAGAAGSTTQLPDVATGLDDEVGVIWRY
jgi:Phosphotransferase enzyme family